MPASEPSTELIPVVILGAGGYAEVVVEILNTAPAVKVLGCTDKAMGLSERSRGEGASLHILGDDTLLPQLRADHPNLHAVIALGPELMDVRARLVANLERLAITPLAVIHSQAKVSTSSVIGPGTVILAGTTVATGCTIGSHCIVGPDASIDHHAQIGNNVYVGQGTSIASYAIVHDDADLEIGTRVHKRVVIGRGVHVTAGTFVNTDAPERAVVSGVPGRVIRYAGE